LIERWDARQESKRTWTATASNANEFHEGRLNVDDDALLSDRDKGLVGGVHDVLDKTHSRSCNKHMGNEIVLKFGAHGPARKMQFQKMAFATTQSQFDSAWKAANADLIAWLPPKETWAKLYSPVHMHGRTASSVISLHTYQLRERLIGTCLLLFTGRGGIERGRCCLKARWCSRKEAWDSNVECDC
jgi:hypothetical protein